MPDIIIHQRINIEKLNREWFFKGEKGTYIDFTLLFSHQKDQYGNNGMIVQAVPKSVWEKEKALPANQKTQGQILGNAIVFEKTGGGDPESKPGYTGPTSTQSNDPFGNAATNANPDPLPNPNSITEPIKNLPF